MPQTKRTVCSRDCPDVCSIIATVEGQRVVRLQGDKADPYTRGFLCARTHRFLNRQYASDRFLEPMLRVDGALKPIGWSAALDLAAQKLVAAKDQYGAASILHYRSGGALGILKSIADVVLARFGPVTVKRGDICSGAGEAAQERDFGRSDSHAVEDLLNAKTILVWGKNPFISGPHLLPILRRAKALGAKIIGIDPLRTQVESLSDNYFQVRPGCDSALALGMARWCFDNDAWDKEAAQYCDGLDGFRRLAYETDVPGWAARAGLKTANIETIARAYTDGPSAILVGWGLGRRENGAQTVRAIDGLAAIAGQIGVPGGGVSFFFARRSAFDVDLGFTTPDPPRTFLEPRLGSEILAATEPPVRVAWITAGNPVAMLPDSDTVERALRNVDFTVVVETHPTDTTDIADLVLPTCTLLEDEDVLGSYGTHYLRASTPVVAPPPGVRHELEIWQQMSTRLGQNDLVSGSVRDFKLRATARLRAAGVRLEDLESGAVRNPFAPEVLFEDRKFETTSGRIQLLEGAVTLPEAQVGPFPLSLMAISTRRSQSSQWAYDKPERPEAAVHPSCTELPDGTLAQLESRRATLEVEVRHDRAVRPGVVKLDKGGMRRDGQCANRLIAAIPTDDGGGAAYYGTAVRLRPLTQ